MDNLDGKTIACDACLLDIELHDSNVASVAMETVKVCNHRFHSGCIQTWCERETSCPQCRHPFNRILLLDINDQQILLESIDVTERYVGDQSDVSDLSDSALSDIQTEQTHDQPQHKDRMLAVSRIADDLIVEMRVKLQQTRLAMKTKNDQMVIDTNITMRKIENSLKRMPQSVTSLEETKRANTDISNDAVQEKQIQKSSSAMKMILSKSKSKNINFGKFKLNPKYENN